ncbi:CLUMA_CG006937, isoform A [Clunio marinus]|uniref:CLUMA_CG006937, isoform A n=1 Tax=Clunio marinus TaxID=568069 RepID=A0A1J1I4U7_9DIPT|nr:CLUMA_CG006937, isoform A [Clunio marinus]
MNMENPKRWWYMTFLFLLLVITICILKISDCSRKNLERKMLVERQLALRNLHKDTNFDILIFTQHWPYTVCAQWMESKSGHECMLPKAKNSWTIHGIWPTKYHTIGPLFCNETWKFDMNTIASIESEMSEKWINIEKGTPLDGLWSHEWEKHGTCAAEHIPQLNSEIKYFQQGLDFLDRFSITKLLMSSYIKPGLDVTYKLEEIHSALSASLDDNFAIVCERDKKSKREYLFEIRICFDLELNLHSCDGIVMDEGEDPDPEDEIITNCQKNQEIAYPSSAWVMQRQWMKRNEERRFVDKSWMKHVVNSYKLVRFLQWVTL